MVKIGILFDMFILFYGYNIFFLKKSCEIVAGLK